MPMWRCPHCGTPQAETARCWVCRRSSTTCSTCRHFRRAVVSRVGWCGLDRKRLPLHGDEMRGCWTDGATVHPGTPAAPDARTLTRPGSLAFVPVGGTDDAGPVPDRPVVPPPAAAPDAWTDRRTLFDEA